MRIPKKYLGWIGLGVVALLLIGWAGVSILVTNAGNQKESKLNGQYLDNQNHMSDCLLQIRDTANIAQAQSDAFSQAMQDAIKGRYEGREANPGSMFSAIIEDYPELTGLTEAYERVHVVVVNCRGNYRLMQTKLLDMLVKYDQWRLGSFTVRTFGGSYPSNNLVAQIGNDRSRRGEVAYDQMWTIVTTPETQESYRTGEDQSDVPFPPTN